MKASDFLDWDEDELEPETEEEVFGQLVKAIADNEGAGWFFVQCSRGQEADVVARLRGRFGRVSELVLERDSVSVYPEAVALLATEDFEVLVVRGLDAAMLGYEDAKRALGWNDADLHNYDPRDVPQILHHFNQMRECWRDLLLRPVVFVVPPFVVRYLILRCADFYDWRIGTFRLPASESERQQLEAWARAGGYYEYLKLSADERWRKALELREIIEAPDTPIADRVYFLQEQGYLFASNQDWELALSSFDRVLKFKPDDHEAWYNRGVALGSLGRSEEAIASYDKALEFKPDDHEAWYNRACAYSLQGNTELALENLRRAIDCHPERRYELAKTDTDFDPIRHDPRFQTLINPETP